MYDPSTITTADMNPRRTSAKFTDAHQSNASLAVREDAQRNGRYWPGLHTLDCHSGEPNPSINLNTITNPNDRIIAIANGIRTQRMASARSLNSSRASSAWSLM